VPTQAPGQVYEAQAPAAEAKEPAQAAAAEAKALAQAVAAVAPEVKARTPVAEAKAPAQAPAADAKEREVKVQGPGRCPECGTGPAFLGCPRVPCPQGPAHNNPRCCYAHRLLDSAPAAMLRSIVDHAQVVGAPAFIRVGGGLGVSHTTLTWQGLVAAWHGRECQQHRRSALDQILRGTGMTVFRLPGEGSTTWFVGVAPLGSCAPHTREEKRALKKKKAAAEKAKKS
jgi:hypothetical protein